MRRSICCLAPSLVFPESGIAFGQLIVFSCDTKQLISVAKNLSVVFLIVGSTFYNCELLMYQKIDVCEEPNRVGSKVDKNLMYDKKNGNTKKIWRKQESGRMVDFLFGSDSICTGP